jgi:hypothetical protein
LILTIFFPVSFFKKYVVQTQFKPNSWQDYESFRNLAEAKATAQNLRYKYPDVEVQILNRLTRRVIQSYPTRRKK